MRRTQNIEELRQIAQQELNQEIQAAAQPVKARLDADTEERAGMLQEYRALDQQLPKEEKRKQNLGEEVKLLREEIEGIKNNPVLKKTPDLQDAAIKEREETIAQHEKDIEACNQSIERIKQQIAEVTSHESAVEKRAQEIVGTKEELSEENIALLWKLVEEERVARRVEGAVRKWVRDTILSYINQNKTSEKTQYMLPWTRLASFEVEDHAILFGNSHVYNRILEEIRATFQSVLGDSAISEDVKNRIKEWKLTIDFGGNNQIVVWKGDEQIGKRTIEAEALLARLNDEEKQVVEEAIVANRYDERFQTREKFAYNLRFSGTREEVMKMVGDEVELMDKEYKDAKIKQNKAYVDGALADIGRERERVTEEIEDAEKARGLLGQYKRAQNEIVQLGDDARKAEDVLYQLQKDLESEQQKLANLPRTRGILGAGKERVKKEHAAAEKTLIASIKKIEGKIAQNKETINTAPEKRAALESEQVNYMREVEGLLPAGAVQNGKLVWNASQVERYPDELRRKLIDLNSQEKELNAAWSIWQEGKFLELALPEMEFIFPYDYQEKYRHEEEETPLDYLALFIARDINQWRGGDKDTVLFVSFEDVGGGQLRIHDERAGDTRGYDHIISGGRGEHELPQEAQKLFKKLIAEVKSQKLARYLSAKIRKKAGFKGEVRFVL